MDRPIIVVDANKAQCQKLCDILEHEHYRVIALHSLLNLETKIQETACLLIILDLDTQPVDNRFIADLRRKNPRLPIIGLSDRPFQNLKPVSRYQGIGFFVPGAWQVVENGLRGTVWGMDFFFHRVAEIFQKKYPDFIFRLQG